MKFLPEEEIKKFDDIEAELNSEVAALIDEGGI